MAGVDIDHLFPLIGIRDYELAVPHALTIAVARQETEFRDLAVSPKGARGLMQIKPSTGSEVASRIGLRGNIKRLLADREYNLRIGSGYLDYLLEKVRRLLLAGHCRLQCRACQGFRLAPGAGRSPSGLR